MCGRKALYIAERGSSALAIHPEEQEITDRGFVQRIGNIRVRAHAIQDAAEDKRNIEIGVVKRLHSEVIASAEKRFVPPIPNCECEIATEMLNAVSAPSRIRLQDEIAIRSWA